MSITTCLFVAIGGAVGTLARYLISVAALPISQYFPRAPSESISLARS